MFAPLVVAMLPLDWLVSGSLGAVTGVDSGDDRDELFARIAVSVQYAIVLLPSLLSFPSGLVRGAARVKRMLPAGTIAGWVLVIMTPVYAVFFVLALILVQHLAGNGVLLAGAALLAASPFVHLAAVKLYIFPLTTDDEVRRLDRVQRLAGGVGLAGMIMILVWAFTATIGDKRIVGGSDGLLDPLGAVLSALELVARVLVTSVVFSYLLLQVTESSVAARPQLHRPRGARPPRGADDGGRTFPRGDRRSHRVTPTDGRLMKLVVRAGRERAGATRGAGSRDRRGGPGRRRGRRRRRGAR